MIYDFRAKRLDDGEWEYGLYVDYPKKAISKNLIDWYFIDEKTVCRFTEKYDKNNHRIYTCDIVKYDKYKNGEYLIGVVEFHNSAFSVKWLNFETYGRSIIGYLYDIEVVGNVFYTQGILKEEN